MCGLRAVGTARCEVGSQCFAETFTERSDELLDGLAGDFFDLFFFHVAFSCEVIGSFSQDRGTNH